MNQTNNTCNICLEDMDIEQGVIKIYCRCQVDRFFHKTCLISWLHINPTCPICSDNLTLHDENIELLIQENIIDDPANVLMRTRIQSCIFLMMFILSLYIIILIRLT